MDIKQQISDCIGKEITLTCVTAQHGYPNIIHGRFTSISDTDATFHYHGGVNIKLTFEQIIKIENL